MAYTVSSTFTINEAPAGADAKFGVSLSTRTFHGEILSCVYVPSSSPVVAAGSAMFTIRRGSSLGDILCKSSSSCGAAQKSYWPRQPVIRSSGLATSGLTAYPALAGDKLCCIRQSGSSDGGQALGMKIKVVIKGAN